MLCGLRLVTVSNERGRYDLLSIKEAFPASVNLHGAEGQMRCPPAKAGKRET